MSLTVMKGDAYSEKRLRKWFEEDGRVVVQTKRDEIRCQVQVEPGFTTGDYRVTFTSASGKPLYNLEQWTSLFIAIYEAVGHRRFDCGVSINNSFDLTRRTVMAKTKPYCTLGRKVETMYDGMEPDPDNPGKRRKHVHFEGTLEAHFWLYDLPEMEASYEARRVEAACQVVPAAGHGVSIPETEVVDIRPGDGPCRMTVTNGVNVVDIIYDKMIEAGHEGAMIKRYDHKWLPKRCPDSWMKLKPEEEADGEIIGYVEGDGKYTGNVGSVTLRFADGSSTTVSGMSDDVRNDINGHREEYIGRIVEIKYMQRDSQGGYRHPRWFRFHPDKTSLE